MIQLAVFDMAGTTIDDGGAVYRALADAVGETGATVNPRDLQAWMGTEKHAALSALITLGGGTVTPDLVNTAYGRFARILADSYDAQPPRALPGIPETLHELRAAGIRIALTTGFTREVATGILDGLGWRIGAPGADNTVTIDALVCGDEVAQGRPAPYLIHRAMERTGVVDVARVLTAGDTIVDVQAGINAGVAHTVGVLTGELTAADFAAAGFATGSAQAGFAQAGSAPAGSDPAAFAPAGSAPASSAPALLESGALQHTANERVSILASITEVPKLIGA